MVKPLDPKQTASIEEVAISSMYVIEALVDLLFEKGIITEEELLRKIEEMKASTIEDEA